MRNFAKDQRIVGAALTAVAMAVVMVGCGGMKSTSGILSSSSMTTNSSSLSGKLSMSVYDGASVVYTDTKESSTANSLTLSAGKPYTIRLSHASPVSGTTYELVATQTNIPDGEKLVVKLVVGNNTFTPLQSGTYSYKITAKAPSGAETTMSYIAAVSCSANTMLTPGSLNTSAISVSAGASANLYNLSAVGLTGSAGTPPFQCAWDPTGTGIKDTNFKLCDTIESNFYSNFVGNRKVNILVKDACGTTVTVTKVLNFAAVEPAMPGNVFISGVVSNPTSSAAGDTRVDGVSYLATNTGLSSHQGARNIVQPAYATGKFEIYSALNYGMPSSVRFGVQIKLKGLTDTLNVAAGTGTVSAANAVIETVTYTTDQAGDSSSALSFTGTGAICTLSNQNARVEVIQGQPCTAGQSGTNKKASVEVWGHYKCVGMTSANGAKIDLEGNFDGVAHSVDDCSGGGGGGGGVKPINL
jgi:hypothetical protein